jgi:hypothetical protein
MRKMIVPVLVSLVLGACVLVAPAEATGVGKIRAAVVATLDQLGITSGGVYTAPTSVSLSAQNDWTAAQRVALADAGTTSVSDNALLRHTTSGTAAAGFGAALNFELEDAGGGSPETAGRIRCEWTTATNTSEDADLVVKLMNDGGASSALEQFRVTSDGRLKINNNTTQILSGSGTPEGAVTAPVGSLFLRTDGSTSTTLYVKTSGTGNTGWTAK